MAFPPRGTGRTLSTGSRPTQRHVRRPGKGQTSSPSSPSRWQTALPNGAGRARSRPAQTANWRRGPSFIADGEAFAAACEQDTGGCAPDADGGLGGGAKPEHQLRVGPVTQFGAKKFAQPGTLERLGVQNRRHSAGGARQQRPLQGLPGIHPVDQAVTGSGQNGHQAGRPRRRRRGGPGDTPSVALGESRLGKYGRVSSGRAE